jgi:hypothetical protein
MRRTLPGVIAMLLVLAACASPGGTPQTTPDPTSSPPPSDGGGIEHPEGDEAVLVVSSAGGQVVQFNATSMPSFVMLGDGRVIIQGAVPAIFPGPALPALLERTLTTAGIQTVLEAVEETGLFTSDLELRGAQSQCADCTDTVFTLNADGRSVTISVYALGQVDPALGIPPGMSSAEVEAHRVLAQLNDALTTIDTSVPGDQWEADGWQAFEPDAFRLYVRDSSGEPADAGVPEEVRDWPTDDDPATVGEVVELFGDGSRCFVVEGEAAAAWFEDLGASTQITRWTTDGTNRYSLLVRPLLPYEDAACPESGAG